MVKDYRSDARSLELFSLFKPIRLSSSAILSRSALFSFSKAIIFWSFSDSVIQPTLLLISKYFRQIDN